MATRKPKKSLTKQEIFTQAHQARLDSWESPFTGLGTSGTSMSPFNGRDKVTTSTFWDPGNLPWPEAVALYHNNALAAKIVEFKPKEMFRKGYRVTIPDTKAKKAGQRYAGDSDNQLAEDLEEYANRIQANAQLLEAWIWGRLFGGDLLILGVDDGLDPSMPLNEDNIRSIKFLNNIDKRFAYAHTYYSDPLQPNFGKPATYMITNTMDGPIGKTFGKNAVLIVHESRCIRFDGSPVDIIKRRQLAGWTLSVLQRAYDIVRAYDTSFQAAANLMVDAAQGVYKMKGVFEMIASGNVTDLQTRMATVDMQRSSGRSLILDADGEDFDRKSTPMSGVPEILDRFMLQVSMAAEIPVNILFGKVNQGMGATGDSDFRAFYDTVASEQATFLKPILLRLYTLILKSKDGPTGGKMPDKVDIEFVPLWQSTPAEQADIELKFGQRDVAYVTAGILLPEEVALSRFRKGQFDPCTEIEVEPRMESLEASHDFNTQVAEKKAEEGPRSVKVEHGPNKSTVGEPDIEVAGQNPRGQPENRALPPPGPGSGRPGETS